MSETITLPPVSTLFSFVDEKKCVSFQLSFNFTGGTFSVSVLKNSTPLPGENAVFSLPFGRVGTVKDVGSSISTGGLVDIVSGPAVPLAATEPGFVSIKPGILYNASTANPKTLAQTLANGLSINWQSYNPQLRAFLYRGNILSGIQQLASIVLGDVIVHGGSIYVVPPGTIVGSNFSIASTDIVSLRQEVDYSLDYPSELNPALLLPLFDPEGLYIFDTDHAHKQGNTTLNIGAPSGTGSKDFSPIPDGWMVDGTYEEWTPPPGTDFTNPATTATNGRYWKQFQSPSDPTKLRGILTFTRLVKDLKLNGNSDNPIKSTLTPAISIFVGSPITSQTNPTIGKPVAEFGGPGFLLFDQDGTAPGVGSINSPPGGIYGFTADVNQVEDIVSGQSVAVQNAMVLLPPGGSSGAADENSFTIQFGLWTFPKVKPTVFGVGDPTNPFNIPPGINIVNPSQNIVNSGGQAIPYYKDYLKQYKKINSPRLKTSVTCVFRGFIPQPGDGLTVSGADKPTCGRVTTVSLSMGRSGLTLSIQAELYQYGSNNGGQQLGNDV